jgi:hypothetical protein
MVDNIGQTMFVITFIVIIILTMIFSTFIYREIEGSLNNSTFSTNQSIAAYERFEQAWPIFDKAVWFILISLVAGVLISAFTIPTHPIYVIGNMLVMAVEIFVSFVLTNMYYAITAQNAVIQDIAQNTYPISTYLISHLPIIAIVVSTLSCIIMFSHGHNTQGFA